MENAFVNQLLDNLLSVVCECKTHTRFLTNLYPTVEIEPILEMVDVHEVTVGRCDTNG